ncbi:hypothetical protein C8Z91_25055 [Paenibacillus elgii]|uniref:Uncharacterized protein n=1 Tax=Paenibacillus elgii TaxID=189691 RepID=A0A2T6FXN2_9BACL|nr:hypothetical protein [Paenibacillus elgii]PUA36649.1 hypothetical protein C8Z91_25055 [Paenibacillus elgii]
MKIADAMNTYNFALEIIINAGFSIKINDNNDNSFVWEAKRGKDTYIASDPLRLLGLVCIGKEYGEKWNEQITPNHYDLILDHHYKY